MADKKKEPIAWITRGGKHIPIFEDSAITKDQDNKDRQIDANKEQAEDKNDTGKVDEATLRKRMKRKLLDRDSYVNDPEYEDIMKKQSEAFQEERELSKRMQELYKQIEEHSTVDEETKNAFKGDPQLAKLFAKPDAEGKKLQEEYDSLKPKRKEAAARWQRYSQQTELIKNENSKIQKEAFEEAFKRGDLTMAEKSKDKYPGFQLDTGTPYYEEATKKGQTFIMEMSPKEYLQRCAYEIFDSTYEAQVSAAISDAKHTADLAKQMREGTEMYMPVLNYEDKQQEGRHRAVAAMLNGYDRIPVLVMPKRRGKR